jgi:hypothetical protein
MSKPERYDPDYDNLEEWFAATFVELWQMESSETGADIEVINNLSTCLGKQDKFIDWIMELIVEHGVTSKVFQKAILNSIDVDRLMMRLNDWRERKTCLECRLCMVDCECDECGE